MDKKKTYPIAKIRSVIRQGSTYYIAMPPEFVKLHGIKKGDHLPVLADHIMKVVPMKEE
ncbi:MAG: hypothetical protein ABSB79_08390 [Syntrophales bacterium]|jgi:hypothetical protein